MIKPQTCPHGIVGIFHCKQCVREYKARWKRSNRAKVSASAKRYAAKNREKINLRRQAWYQANPDYNREYHRANKDKAREHSRAWKKANPDKVQASAKRYYANHKEATLERTRAWDKANIIRSRLKVQCRRARMRQAKGKCTAEQWQARIVYFGWRCYYCSLPLTIKTVTTDHFFPLSLGGTNWPSNLFPACLSCNSGKCDLNGWEFIARKK